MMIARVLVCGVFVLSAPIATVSAQTAPAVSSELEACIRDNAAGVERAIDDLSQAVDFLVTKRCAREEAAERRAQYERQAAGMRAMWQRQCEQHQASGRTPRDEEGEAYDPCAMSTVYESAQSVYVTSNFGSANPEATALAAELLLGRRLERRR